LVFSTGKEADHARANLLGAAHRIINDMGNSRGKFSTRVVRIKDDLFELYVLFEEVEDG